LDINEIKKDRRTFAWLLTFSILQILPVPVGIFSMFTNIAYVWCTCIPPAAAALLAAINLFLHPQLLYGTQSPVAKQPSPVEEPPESIELAPIVQLPAPPKAVMDEALFNEKKELLEKLMAENKPWLNSNYALADLANDLRISVHQASALINQATGRNFNDYINQQRIDHAIALIKEGKSTDLNMKGIAELCGFNNRNTFTLAFKKFTGMSPSEFRDRMRYGHGS
jgi:AraC-like DNA-binding protein